MVTLKLHILVDKKKNKLLFAEAGNDFVDFIFHILSLPLGAVARILTKSTLNLGSLVTLREGLKNLDTKYIELSGKQYLLDAVKAPCSSIKNSQLLPDASFFKPHTFYKCKDSDVYLEMPCRYNRSFDCCSLETFPGLGWLKDGVMGRENGYVSTSMSFMVMDDLTVRALAATSVFSLLDELSISDVGTIEKREVAFGTNEAVKLLMASLSSKTVLTDVFLPGEAAVKAEK